MVNWRFMANALWTTDETIRKMEAASNVKPSDVGNLKGI
jgi:hypothetical protein